MLLLQVISLSKYDVSRDLSYYLLSLPTRPQEGDILVSQAGFEPAISSFQGRQLSQTCPLRVVVSILIYTLLLICQLNICSLNANIDDVLGIMELNFLAYGQNDLR